jgi:probable F420-dependent oxidoreductase
MHFGFYVPTRGPLAAPENMSVLARNGEALGFHCLSMTDHLVVPRRRASAYPYTRDGNWTPGRFGDFLDQPTALTFLAGQTSIIRLVTSVLVLPHRPAVATAKALATLDYLSGGRLSVGCGAGWMKEEFEALGAPPHAERGTVADEFIEAFKALWTREDPEYHGKFVDFSEITFEPKPVQKPHPPILIGGESIPAMRRTVRLADGWLPIGHNATVPLDTEGRLRSRLGKLHRMAEEAGRDPASISLTYFVLWWGTRPGDPLPPLEAEGSDPVGDRRLLTGSAQQMKDDLALMESLGFDTLILNFEAETLEATLDSMSAFAREFIARPS